jgi:hypothetical protein
VWEGKNVENVDGTLDTTSSNVPGEIIGCHT